MFENNRSSQTTKKHLSNTFLIWHDIVLKAEEHSSDFVTFKTFVWTSLTDSHFVHVRFSCLCIYAHAISPNGGFFRLKRDHLAIETDYQSAVFILL